MPTIPGVTAPPDCSDGHTVDPNGDQADWLKPPYNVGPCQNYWDEYTFTLRIQATDNNGHVGEDRRSLQSPARRRRRGAPATARRCRASPSRSPTSSGTAPTAPATR